MYMKLTFIGVSSAFAVGKNIFQSNMLLESTDGRRLLIDCGSDARHALHALGYTYRDIDAVYISHLHSDHVGGLEWLGFCRRFNAQHMPSLYISEDQRDTLWQHVLSGGMSTLEEEQASLSTYFKIEPVVNRCFTWENERFELIKTKHTVSNGKLLPSYGLLIGEASKVFITTDSRFTPANFEDVYLKSELIFQDCEISANNTMQHARYDELKKLPQAIKKKMSKT